MKQINVAIAGLGVVGSGVYKILTSQIDLLNRRSKTKINLVAVSSRSVKDFVDDPKIKFYSNALDLTDDKNINVIIETIGGSEGIALELCKKSLQNKKHFVTANKAMIAIHGLELAKLAEENNVVLAFEASVAAAIPTLKNIKEGLCANQISKIYGILNGTGNYILSKMEEDEASFVDALKQAQDLGYAESDPTFDIEGIDTAHKIAILAAIAKNSVVKMGDMHIEGITKISLFDIKFAKEFDFKIKLLGVFKDLGDNNISQAVYPCLIPCQQNIAQVNDSFNAVLSFGDNCDWNLQVGRGAGSKPTASAIVADVIDIANGHFAEPFGCAVKNLKEIKIVNLGQRRGGYYLRFVVDNIYAQENNLINNIFGENEIVKQSSIEEIDGNRISYGLITEEVLEEEFLLYVDKIIGDSKIDNINWIRIFN